MIDLMSVDLRCLSVASVDLFCSGLDDTYLAPYMSSLPMALRCVYVGVFVCLCVACVGGPINVSVCLSGRLTF